MKTSASSQQRTAIKSFSLSRANFSNMSPQISPDHGYNASTDITGHSSKKRTIVTRSVHPSVSAPRADYGEPSDVDETMFRPMRMHSTLSSGGAAVGCAWGQPRGGPLSEQMYRAGPRRDAVEAAPRVRTRLRALIDGSSGFINSFHRQARRGRRGFQLETLQRKYLRVCLPIPDLHP